MSELTLGPGEQSIEINGGDVVYEILGDTGELIALTPGGRFSKDIPGLRPLAEALVAQPFDPAAVVAVLDLERRLISDLTARGTALLMEQITRMSPEDRAAYAEALRQEPEPSGDRRGPEKGKHFRP